MLSRHSLLRYYAPMMRRPILLVVCTLALTLGFLSLYRGEFAKGSLESLAEATVRACKDAENKMHCYEQDIPALYPERSVGELFTVIRRIRELDHEYQFCHVLAHELGEKVVAEDPPAWLDAISMNPRDGLCSNGFIHGVVGGRFRAEVLDGATIDSLIPDFSRACEARMNWHPSDLDRSICYHGMGHLYDFITDADIPRAIDICSKTANPQFLRMCIEGVYMQIYQPLEPDDFELLKRMPTVPTKETVRAFCAGFENDTYEGACLRESWPFFAREIRAGTGVGTFCLGQPNSDEEKKCYETTTAIIGRMSLGDSAASLRACESVPSTWREMCFTAVARAVIEEDRDEGSTAVELCKKAPPGIAASCIQTLASQARFMFGPDTVLKERFCTAVPSEYQSLCRQ